MVGLLLCLAAPPPAEARAHVFSSSPTPTAPPPHYTPTHPPTHLLEQEVTIHGLCRDGCNIRVGKLQEGVVLGLCCLLAARHTHTQQPAKLREEACVWAGSSSSNDVVSAGWRWQCAGRAESADGELLLLGARWLRRATHLAAHPHRSRGAGGCSRSAAGQQQAAHVM